MDVAISAQRKPDPDRLDARAAGETEVMSEETDTTAQNRDQHRGEAGRRVAYIASRGRHTSRSLRNAGTVLVGRSPQR